MLKVGIYGATGYTGIELVRILRRRPDVALAWATSESQAGGNLGDTHPVPWDVPLIAEADADPGAVDAVFCCLPHGVSMKTVVAARAAGARVIDFSADFRLRDPAVYQQWYGLPHVAPDLLGGAVYGLPEVYRHRICQAGLVAVPGCYPTSILLALYPLLRAGLVAGGPVIADSKSGVSGAGRKPSLKTHFVEASENFSPYNIGRAHRHWPEIAQEITAMGGDGAALIFSPHLTPVNRGMLSTLYVTVPAGETLGSLHKVYEQTYDGEPFIWLLPEGQLATMAHAVRTNRCALSLTLAGPGQLIVCSAIDNLVKGASGEAVQNFNLMFGLDETAGLTD
jgi:N-acetyl-gamma-glutamyl-phosphate reductase